MDDVDRAQEINEAHLAEALALRLRSGTRRSLSEVEVCIDCDEPIPDARRKAVPGCCRCIDCQAEFECGHTTVRPYGGYCDGMA